MIVECFGPPCVGKTTFASAVAAQLRANGRNVQLILSHRPAERSAAGAAGSATARSLGGLRRLVRPAIESIAALARPGGPGEAQGNCGLMRVLAPRRFVQRLRLRQYLLRLSKAVRESAATADIVIIDQGFVQAVYTAALLAKVAEPERLRTALDAVPEADLLVRVKAPADIIEDRSAERRRGQGRIERLLDAWTRLESPCLFERLNELLLARGRAVVCIDGSDRDSLTAGAEKVGSMIAAVVQDISLRCSVGQEGLR